jgi:hypothetical protein
MVSKDCFQTCSQILEMIGPYRIQCCLPNNTFLLVTIDKFDPNPVFVNINKLKPYRFIEDKTLQ